MIPRLLTFACLAAWPLTAGFTFSVVRDGMETPAAAQVQIGSAAPGDTVTTLFRVRNTGNSIAPLITLAARGAGFTLADLPVLPAILLPGVSVDFTVRFQPAGAGAFSTTLQADGVSVFLTANGLAALTVYLEQAGVRTQINSATPVDFGTVQRGAESASRFVLVNQTADQLISTLSTVGVAFQLAAGAPHTVILDPQASATVAMTFGPTRDGAQQGAFQVDSRSFSLLGNGVEPPLPKPLVIVDLNGLAPASGMQPQVQVRFDPAPATSGTGKLRIDFQPSLAGATDDPAILFLSTASRTIDFSVIEGESSAQFGVAGAVPFQTGTTAGTIVFTAELGDYAETASVEIPSRPAVIDSVKLTRSAGTIGVQVSGYDNTRSLAQASFTFLQPDGTAIPPGAIQQDVSAAFRDYFANSGLGGVFSLNATFPVTGGADLIDSVKVVLSNSVGQTTWPDSSTSH